MGTRYTPALRFHWLTRLYDPLMERWSASRRLRAAVIAGLDVAPGLRLLELGCGPGRLAVEIKRREPGVVLDAVDVDPRMVERARRNALAAGVEIAVRQGDITALREDVTYDRIYSTLVFHHLSPPGKEAALAGARRMLVPGGRFVIADFVRPAGSLQAALFSLWGRIEGWGTTAPHYDGRFERMLANAFPTVERVGEWRTVFGTIGAFVCR